MKESLKICAKRSLGNITFNISCNIQYSPDNLTLANSHAPLNLHACSGHNSAVDKNVT